MDNKKNWELRTLKLLLWIYILLCLIIAGLNYGYVQHATADQTRWITRIWQIYENEVKTVFILVGSYLTLRIETSRKKRTTMRQRNLTGLIITALIVHFTAPILLKNQENYFFAMPLPWTTAPLRLLYPSSTFYQTHFPIWGLAGISATLIFYLFYSLVVFLGTFLLGRRWQCSILCLFNGFASEVFAPVFPLIGHKKKLTGISLRFFNFFRWIFLVLGIIFTVLWIMTLSGFSLGNHIIQVEKIETYKYLSTELLMAIFFWITFTGRGYCYYCPLGTTLSLISKAAGQEIITDRTQCIQCGQCNRACPMTIEIMAHAAKGEPVRDFRCVGCGHCVDNCPTETLAYSTAFLKKIIL